MNYRLYIYTDEVEDFKRELLISSEATFRELNDFLLEILEYSQGEITYFSICDRNWVPGVSILLLDMGTGDEDEPLYLMDETSLDFFIKKVGDRMLFTFDILADRSFYIELIEVQPGEALPTPFLEESVGEAPSQYSDPMELLLEDTPVKYRTLKSDGEADDDEQDEFGLYDLEIGVDELDLDSFDFFDEE